jgi:hypothetical protein
MNSSDDSKADARSCPSDPLVDSSAISKTTDDSSDDGKRRFPIRLDFGEFCTLRRRWSEMSPIRLLSGEMPEIPNWQAGQSEWVEGERRKGEKRPIIQADGKELL